MAAHCTYSTGSGLQPPVAIAAGRSEHAAPYLLEERSLLEKLHIDDPVGAAPVHLFGGIWGVLAVGIFARGNPDTATWNGVPTPVTGLLYGGTTQILAQVSEVAAICVVVGGLGYVFFKILSALGILRSKPADELAGLDLPEMGAPGYTNDDVVMHGGLPGGRFRGSISPARPTSVAPPMR